MKHIDAEKLKVALKKLFESGRYCNPDDIISIITSLQQEQQDVDLEKEIKDYTETIYHEIFGNGKSTLDEFDWEDIVQVIDNTARYFYELILNARKEE